MEITDAIGKLQAAGDDPEARTLATVEIVLSAHGPELLPALEAAAVPHWFDGAILAALLDVDPAEAEAWCERLSGLPFVEPFSARDGWNVHEATRLALRDRLHREEPERLVRLSGRAGRWFAGDDPVWRVEEIYHRLIAEPEAAADALERLWRKWHDGGRHESLQALGLALGEQVRTDHLQLPARARALLCYGLIGQASLPVREIEPLARQALELFRALDHPAGEMDAHDLLGDTLTAEGNLTGALAEYREFHRIALDLTGRDPDNSGWLRELSVSHNKVGDVLQAQGRLADALAEYREDLRIMLDLTGRDPDNSGWLRELSVSHNNISSVLAAQGDLEGALEESQADLSIAERLAALDPDNAQWQKDLEATQGWVEQIRSEVGRK